MDAGTRTGTDRSGRATLTTGTLVAALLAVCVGQVALAIPAVLNGLFQTDWEQPPPSSPGSPTPSSFR